MMPIIIEDLAFARLQEPRLRMRHNVLLMHRNQRFGFSTDTPLRIRGYDYANFLSSAYNTLDVTLSIVRRVDRSFGNEIEAAVLADGLMNYVKASRNAEDHSLDSAGARPAYAAKRLTKPDGSSRIVFERGAWCLRPVTKEEKKSRRKVIVAVPTKHRDHDVHGLTPESLAAYYYTWWGELHDLLFQRRAELPPSGLPELLDFEAAANGPLVEPELDPDLAGHEARFASIRVI